MITTSSLITPRFLLKDEAGNIGYSWQPDATNEVRGVVKVDGTTIVSSNGVLSAGGSIARNINELVQALAPLKDAGLHLLDGALIQGGGIYANYVNRMAELYADSSKLSNIVNIGLLADNDNVLSGFSASNYAKILATVPLASANSFEFVCKFTYTTSSAIQSIFAENNVTYFSQISINASDKIYCQLSNNHSSNNIGSSTGTTTLTSGNTYYIKFAFTGSAYKVYLSSTGAFSGEESEEISITSSAKLLSYNWNIGCSALSKYEQPFSNGSIDLKESYININGERWWTGAHPAWAVDEETWQNTVNTYGSCGKFVYDSTNNTVRLPKVSDILQCTTDVNALGDLILSGLPSHTHTRGSMNITGSFWSLPVRNDNAGASGCFTATQNNSWSSGGDTDSRRIDFNAAGSWTGSTSAPNYSSAVENTSKVQPQTINCLVYIVIASSAKTDIEVDIDNIASDLNSKADTDLVNVTDTAKALMSSMASPSNVIVKITTGASGSSYTAPANGWFRVSSSASSSTSGWIYMTSSSGLTNQPSNTANNGINGFLPCKKGDVVTMQFWGLANTPYICFVYAQGSAVNK